MVFLGQNSPTLLTQSLLREASVFENFCVVLEILNCDKDRGLLRAESGADSPS